MTWRETRVSVLGLYKNFAESTCTTFQIHAHPSVISVGRLLSLWSRYLCIITNWSPEFTLGFALGAVQVCGLWQVHDVTCPLSHYSCRIASAGPQWVLWSASSSLCPSLFLLPPCLESLAIIDLFTVSVVLPFSECYMVSSIHYVAFPDWLIYLVMDV